MPSIQDRLKNIQGDVQKRRPSLMTDDLVPTIREINKMDAKEVENLKLCLNHVE